MGQVSDASDILTLLQSPHGVRGIIDNPSSTLNDDPISPLGTGEVSVGVHTPHDFTEVVSNADGLPIGSPTSDMTSIKTHMAPIAMIHCDSYIRSSHPGERGGRNQDPSEPDQEINVSVTAAPNPSLPTIPSQKKEQVDDKNPNITVSISKNDQSIIIRLISPHCRAFRA